MYFQEGIGDAKEKLQQIVKYWDDINKSIVNSTQSLGQTNDSLKIAGSYTHTLNKNFEGAAVNLERMGVGTKEVAQFLSNMSDYTGTMVGFASKAMEKYGALQKILGASNIDQTLENYNSLGKGLTTSTQMIEEMTMASYKMGLNATKVAKTMNTNFKMASNISFKGGAKEIAEMARESVMLGVDMGKVLTKARELRSPEQAIEFSQNMQMLGGDFANLFGDASNVLYNARNNTKQFQKDISKAAGSLLTMNSETGELDALGENFDRASLAATQLGMDVDEFLEAGRKAKKLDIFKNMFGELDEKDANVLTGFMNIKKGGKIALEGLEKLDFSSNELKDLNLTQESLSDISQLTSKQMAGLAAALEKSSAGGKDGAKTIEDQVMATQQLTDVISNLANVMAASSTATNQLSKDINASTNLGGARGRIQDMTAPGTGSYEYMKNIADGLGKSAGLIINKVGESMTDFFDELKKQIETSEGEDEGGVPGESKGKNKGKKTSAPNEGGVPGERRGTIIKSTKTMGTGGLFKGPSHEEGGIPVLNKTNGKMLEVEGGEAIINKKSTEMFKPLLSKLNEAGGGVKFAEGGITPVDLENIMSKMGSMTNTSNINVGSNSPVNVNVNVNGSISIDGKDFTIPDDEKEKLSKNLIKEVMIKVNSEIGQSTIFTGGKRKTADNTFNY